jgi:hypothetical protein
MAFGLVAYDEAARPRSFAPFFQALEGARRVEAACAALPASRAKTRGLVHAIALRAEIFRRAEAPPPGVEPVAPYDEATLKRFAERLRVDPHAPNLDGSPLGERARLLRHLRTPSLDPTPLPLLEALVLGCFEPSLADRHALRVTLALAPHGDARALAERLGGGTRCRFVERLLLQGFDASPGWAGTFLGRLDAPDDASIYEPSAALARALFERGVRWWPAAERVLRALAGAEREQALSARASALYVREGVGAAIAALRALPAGHARGAAALSLAWRAADRRRPDDARAFAESDAGASGRAALVVAAALREAGERLEARRWLGRVKSPALAPWVELERARLDLDAGLPARAAARLAALPRALRCPSREPAPWLGEPPAPCRRAPGFAVEAALLELELVVRRGRDAAPLALTSAQQSALLHHHDGLVRLYQRLDHRLRPETIASAVANASDALTRALAAAWVAHTAAAALRALDEALAARPPVRDAAGLPSITPARAFALGVGGDPAAWHDFRSAQTAPGDWVRCCYDEGVSLSPARESHREALVRASRGVLREALRPDARTSAEVVASRLRCLTNLGAARAAASLERVLRAAPGDGTHLRTAFLHLLRLSPARAGTLFLERPEVFYGGGLDSELARALEAKGVFERHSADAWVALATNVARHARDKHAPLAWISAFGPLWLQRFGRPPGTATLHALAALLSTGPATPAEALARLEAQRERLVDRPPGEFFDALTRTPLALATLRALAPDDDGSGGPRWDDRRWRALLDRLRELPLRVDEAAVRRLAGALTPSRDGPDLVRALLEGSCPVPAGRWPLGRPEGEHLRYLDKRRDVLAFLRLADSVMCCFHSSSCAYGDPATGRGGNYRWVLALWCDPLSFCLHVARGADGEGPPAGFVFGSFGLAGSKPVLLLNGIYLRRQDERTRAAVLARIEASLARPLGVTAIAVGNRFGGGGPLPRGYDRTPRTVVRLRALQDYAGTPLRTVYDDISSVTNQPFVTDRHVAWKTLS